MKVSIFPWIAKKLKQCMAITQDGDTADRAIASGKYVCWKSDMYTANQAINSGDTLSAGSGGNLTAVDDGIANGLNSEIANKLDTANVYNGLDKTASGFALDARQAKRMFDVATITTGFGLQSGWSKQDIVAIKCGKVVTLRIRGVKKSSAVTSWTTAFTIPDSILPAYEHIGIMKNDTANPSTIIDVKVTTNGNFQIYAVPANNSVWGSVTYITSAAPSNI